MLKLLPAVAMALICVHVLQGTVVVSVGTKDGIVVCEDNRVTRTDQDNKQTFTDSTHKSQPLGRFGLWAAAGALWHVEQHSIGGVLWNRSHSSYDMLEEIRTFFESNNIQEFGPAMASKFESRLKDELRKTSFSRLSLSSLGGPTRGVVVFLYWIDSAGEPNVYAVGLTDDWRSDDFMPSTSFSLNGLYGIPPPRVRGRFLPLSLFETSKPVIAGDGALVYSAFASSEDETFKSIRESPEFKPFLTDFVSSEFLEPIQTTRIIKRLIKTISENQDSVRAGIGVGPTSDCFLLHKKGVRDMNDELEKVDAALAKRAIDTKEKNIAPMAPRTNKKSKNNP